MEITPPTWSSVISWLLTETWIKHAAPNSRSVATFELSAVSSSSSEHPVLTSEKCKLIYNICSGLSFQQTGSGVDYVPCTGYRGSLVIPAVYLSISTKWVGDISEAYSFPEFNKLVEKQMHSQWTTSAILLCFVFCCCLSPKDLPGPLVPWPVKFSECV